VLISFTSLDKNICDHHLKRRKGLFWLTVMGMSVNGQLAHCFWTCDEIAHCGGSVWQKFLISWWPGSKKRVEGVSFPCSTRPLLLEIFVYVFFGI
jgi:hypothetical protein